MTTELADNLRGWLKEPNSGEVLEPVVLDQRQKELVYGRPGEPYPAYRRIKGAAGSGKTVVLAARAAHLAQQGKRVLVISYNITMLNYIGEIAKRNYLLAGNAITRLHFHEWLRRAYMAHGIYEDYRKSYASNKGYTELYQNDDSVRVTTNHLCSKLIELIDKDGLSGWHGAFNFDAILVDEGQDLEPLWWNLLRKTIPKEGLALFVADLTQDIYSGKQKWTDTAMLNAGFRGGWVRLDSSYRLPEKLSTQVAIFGKLFMQGQQPDLPTPAQSTLHLEPCTLHWSQLHNVDAIPELERAVIEMLAIAGVGVVTVIVADRVTGLALQSSLKQNCPTIACETTFFHSSDSLKSSIEERKLKKSFGLNPNVDVQITTIYSFKGWESSAIVLHINKNCSSAVVYTGLTRLKSTPVGSHLTVVCASEKYSVYGNGWGTSPTSSVPPIQID